MDGTFAWQPAYLAAVYETDDAMMMSRIFEARAAIEQRLLVPIEQDSTEYRELTAARNALELLKSERVDQIDRPTRRRFWFFPTGSSLSTWALGDVPPHHRLRPVVAGYFLRRSRFGKIAGGHNCGCQPSDIDPGFRFAL
jgi:hypothetical protein